MTALEDRRPAAALTTASGRPVWIGAVLSQLLTEHPEIDLTSVRLIPNEDGSVGIAGRVGPRPGVECPQCHTPVGRPHTEYCTLAPDQVWDGVLPSAPIDPAEDLVGQALAAVDAGNAGHWPTVAAYLADEVRRLDPARALP